MARVQGLIRVSFAKEKNKTGTTLIYGYESDDL